MSKAVLISIRPEWCEKIINGQKTIEVRKTRPKIEPPFKCYLYCTKPNTTDPHEYLEIHTDDKIHKANGKVIGEFVCDSITEYMPEFWPGDDVYNAVWVYDTDETGVDHDFMYAIMSNEDDTPRAFEKAICMSIDALKEYLGTGELLKPFYGWRISDLVIYDMPKELNEYMKPCPIDHNCFDCCYHHPWFDENGKCEYKNISGNIRRPPQSWCYVEELDGN